MDQHFCYVLIVLLAIALLSKLYSINASLDQVISSTTKPQVSEPISGENSEVDDVDTNEPVDKPTRKE